MVLQAGTRVACSTCICNEGAPKPVRWIWAHGRFFLAVSAALDIALLVIGLIRQGEVNDQSLLSLIAAVVDLYFLVYILAARRVRHAFSEFPLPVASTESVTQQ